MVNGGRAHTERKAGTPGGEANLPSPWRAFLVGILAGAIFSIFLSAALFLTVDAGERRVALLYVVLPIPGAGVSACAAALAKGASPGRALGVALLALLGATFLAGPLQYALFASMVVPPFEPSAPGYESGLPASGLVAFTTLAIAAGTVLGLMLGGLMRGRGAPSKR